MDNARRWQVPLVAFALIAVSACGINPVITWQRQPEPSGHLDSMEVARARADALKRALHEKAREQVGAQVALNDALLGLGVLAVASGASSLHRDVYMTLAVGAGSGYLYGVQNLPKSRLDVYQSGIGAVNCAVEAVRPLQVGDTQLMEIRDAAGKVKNALPKLAATLAASNRLYSIEPALPGSLETQVRDQIESAKTAYTAAVMVLSDAAVLPTQVALAAGQLKGTLEVIDAQVNRLASNTVADAAATTRAIADLAQIAGRFAPGLGVDTILSARLASRGAAQSTAVGSIGVSAALASILNDLALAQAELQAVYRPLATWLTPFKGHLSTEALKACGVSDAVIAIRVDREEVSFSTAIDEVQTRTIRVSGGSKPYVARFIDSPTRGMEVISPVAGDSTVEVRAPKNMTGTFELSVLIMDASQNGQSKIVKIKVDTPQLAKVDAEKKPVVGEAEGNLVADQAKANAVALAADLGKMAASLTKLPTDQDFAPEASNHKFRFVSAKVIGATLNVTMTCISGTGVKDTRLAVQKAFVTFAEAKSVLAPGTEARLVQRISPQGVAACMT